MSSKIGNKAAAETCPLQSAGSQLAPSDPKPIQVVQLDSMRRDAMSLTGTKIEYRSEDDAAYVPDYPLLPVRWRFWEKVLRAVDMAGTAAQLRNQLELFTNPSSAKIACRRVSSCSQPMTSRAMAFASRNGTRTPRPSASNSTACQQGVEIATLPAPGFTGISGGVNTPLLSPRLPIIVTV